MTGQPVRQFSAAPDDSLDGRAIAERESYVSLGELRKMGAIPGQALGAGFKTARLGRGGGRDGGVSGGAASGVCAAVKPPDR